MGVKRSQGAARILTVLETVSMVGPIGVSELARHLEEDKSTIQRMLVTLADEGWIRAAAGGGKRWEITGRVRALAHLGGAPDDLRKRLRTLLEDLRDHSGETTAVTMLDGDRMIVTDIAESRETLRTAPRIGQSVPDSPSASALAVLPYLTAEQGAALLQAPIDGALVDEVATRGFAVRANPRSGGSVNVATAIRDMFGKPIGALVISAPAARVGPGSYPALGAMLLDAIARL